MTEDIMESSKDFKLRMHNSRIKEAKKKAEYKDEPKVEYGDNLTKKKEVV